MTREQLERHYPAFKRYIRNGDFCVLTDGKCRMIRFPNTNIFTMNMRTLLLLFSEIFVGYPYSKIAPRCYGVSGIEYSIELHPEKKKRKKK